jgi:hypothetical protein
MGKVKDFYGLIEDKWKKMEIKALSDFIKDKKKKKEKKK